MTSTSTHALRVAEASGRPEPTSESMRRTLAGYPTGVAVVAARIDGRIVGLSANSLVSVSLEPPLVSISFARTSTTWPLLRRASRWGISVLSENQEPVVDLLRRPAGQRFDGIDMDVRDDGHAFVHDSLAALIVTRRAEIDAGDHVLVLLEVHHLDRNTSLRPLVFFDSTTHQLSR
ncbi:flavin reductase family protein [Promicromonospora iranensis]|uniref:flavin reductase family protein n=1 Tax=Promicromonospora iranensis TaxID=1105144 RepID=UPI0023A98647|nr:flavin reductase family protein [Promicromonospora iranensis]